jgi:hypothetical protein
MRLIFPIVLFVSIVFSACDKSNDPVHIANCDGLVTDTAGTGDNGRVYMPNAFSPNNDGLNEFSKPFLYNISSMVFTIYDENNILQFSTTIPGQGWQPTIGTNSARKYYFKVQAITNAGKKIGICGDVYSLTCFPVNLPKSFFYFDDMLTPNGFTGTTAESLPACY